MKIIMEIFEEAKYIWLNQMINEPHLSNELLSDCQQSLHEMKYAITLQNLI